MDRRELAKRRRWADSVVLATGAFVLGWAIWIFPRGGPVVEQGTLLVVHAIGGSLALGSVFAALHSTPVARVLLVLAAATLLVGTFLAFQRLTLGAVLTLLLPGLVLLAMVPFVGPMPTPEEGLRR